MTALFARWRNLVNSLHGMLVGLVALTLAPVLVLTLASYVHDRALARAAAVTEAARAAGLVARALGQETANARIILELLAANPNVRGCAGAECQEALAHFSRVAPHYSNLLLVRPDGQVLRSAKPAPGNMAVNPALEAALAGQSFALGVSVEEKNTPGPGTLVNYAAPVQNAAGGISLVVVAQLPVGEVAKIFEDAALPPGTTLVLAGQSGRILYRLPEAPRYAGASLPREQADRVRAGDEEMDGWGVGLDGVHRYYVMKRLDICRDEVCYVRVGIPRDAVYAGSSAKLLRHLAALAGIVALALVLARLWARRSILGPSARLMETVRALDAGDFSARTGIADLPGELGELAGSIDHMAAALMRHKEEQEAARSALFESEERLRAIFNASSDGMLLLVPDGHVLAMNESAALRRGKTPQDLAGANILDLIPSYVRDGRRSRFEDVVRTGRALRFEEERDGRTYAIRLHPVHNEAGEIVQIASFSRDITERKLAERALTAAKEAAETASQAKSAFLSNMSHELRTPLNGLLGMLELLRAEKSEEQRGEYLAWATQSAQQITRLVNDILDYAALGAGETRIEHRSFRLAEVLAPLETVYTALAQDKGLEFGLNVAPGLLEQPLMGDPGHLAAILRQILDNAIKFTNAGGVRLSAQVACRDAATCTLRLEVKDTGIGIAPEVLSHVFKPFVQGEAPLTKSYAGAGLGLAIASELAARMGGSLELQSAPGVGSTFTLSLSFLPAQPG